MLEPLSLLWLPDDCGKKYRHIFISKLVESIGNNYTVESVNYIIEYYIIVYSTPTLLLYHTVLNFTTFCTVI